MCDALIDTLMYLHEYPQTTAQLTEHTDIPTDRASWHLHIFTDWHLTRLNDDGYRLTDAGQHLTDQLRRHLRVQGNPSLNASEILALASASAHPTTPNAITRSARDQYGDNFEAMRYLKRAIADMVSDGRMELCVTEEKKRAQYRRTARGHQALADTLTRWETIAHYLPPAAATLTTQPQAVRAALNAIPITALETA